VFYAPLAESNEVLGSDLLSGWDFTSGWVPNNATNTDANTVTINVLGGYTSKQSLITVGSRYRMRIVGVAAAGITEVRITGAGFYQSGFSGTFDKTFDFTGDFTTLFIRGIGTGTIDVSFMTVQQLTTQDVVAGNNGTFPNGISYGTDRLGRANRAMVFDGVNQYVTMGDVLQIGTSDRTILCWVKNAWDGTGLYGIFGHNIAMVTNGRNGLYLSSTDANKAKSIFLSAGSGAVSKSSTTSVNDNTWRLVGATYDRSGNLSIWVNGVSEASIDISGGLGENLDSGLALTIGQFFANTGLPDNFYAWALSDPMIFNRVLTQSEITKLYEREY
jgi:hypothetical protein